ncbi:DEAD/DEAH box helicase family protein [Wielerella bovis]|uniref:DEAD/DEAH box helicase family protein n=1 Tax=Wielerella bovis TaxID=2917790 RepID=UPI00201901CE|nr:DEAD/DEAH box helicase family protein [Wielerella bovis]ULJ64117.1 DEAD/DEAH box helicase family protein [Wielerella bovis]
MAKNTKTTKNKQVKLNFHDHLILNQWLLSLFNVEKFQDFFGKNPENFEGIKGDNTLFLDEILYGHFFRLHNSPITQDELRRYDLNIVKHWQKITKNRNKKDGFELKMKYFQYLSLLFTEIYLDWYFHKPHDLLNALNQAKADYESNVKEAKIFSPFDLADLASLAFWNATGSGKTLIMHANILQYQYYAKKIDKIIVLTTNEGLSKQHLDDLLLSDFRASLFDKNAGELLKSEIEIIEITKLADKDGDKTVSASNFSGNNLVLIDEGHRGSKGEQWLKYRDILSKGGFSFEYSATLGQVVSGNKNPLFEKYAKSIIFDYSYKYFYADGFGKESLILNIQKDNDYFENHQNLYLTACLLSFYQQKYLFANHQTQLGKYNIDNPLMIFVGSKVADDNSDILKVVDFLAYFVNQSDEVIGYLKDLIGNTARLVNDKGVDIFNGRFNPLNAFIGKEHELYANMIQLLMNAEHKARLRLTHLKKSDGELSLSLGENGTPFAVINIGDSGGLFKTASENFSNFDCVSDDFGAGYFAQINRKESPINILIGSKKFTEGWSSWRVSTMGLLNVGKNEGSQIIQLFGRGVRLKGQNMSLRRSVLHERPKEFDLKKLETLNIFGINADYMETFRAYLSDEGIDTSEVITISFDAKPNLPKDIALKTLQLDEAYKGNREKSFKRSETVTLFEIPEKYANIKMPVAVLDLYPKIQAITSRDNALKITESQKQKGHLNAYVFDFVDWDKIYLALLNHKMWQSFNNLKLDKARLKDFAKQTDWYKLYVPQSELQIQSFADIQKQEKILLDLLLIYLETFYKKLKGAYEGQFYKMQAIDNHHTALLENYVFEIRPNEDDGVPSYQTKLGELKDWVESGDLAKIMGFKDGNVHAICFDRHLFYPIISLQDKDNAPFSLKPLLMQEKSERKFVQDLQNAHDTGKLKDWIGDKELYLLRNASNKAKGLGFALAGDFYPDFLLWLVDKNSDQQWLTFVDPKGIRQLSFDDPKFMLFDELKKFSGSLNLDKLTLNSFILSITPSTDTAETGALNHFGKTYQEFADKHILFMENMNGVEYLQHLFNAILDDNYLNTVNWET